MHRCRIQKELSSYLDNQLSNVKKQEVDQHLQACKVCSQELAKLKAVSDKLKAWQAPELDLSFDGSLRNKIVSLELERGRVKMKRKSWLILVPSGVLAGILVIAFLQVTLHRGFQGKLQYASDKVGEEAIRSRKANWKVPAFAPNELAGRKKYAQRGEKDGLLEGRLEWGGVNGQAYSVRQVALFEKSAELAEKFAWNRNVDNVEKAAITPQQATTVASSSEGSIIVIQPVLPATGEGAQIIRTADIQLEVENGKDTYKKTSEICQELGGYLAESNFYKDTEGRESGRITLRIPKDKFTLALDKLNALGKVISLTTNSQDVSQEYANLKARLDAAMVAYNKMFEALQKRQVTAQGAIRIESELTPVRQRVEDLKNQIEHLNNLASFTTINVNFHEAMVSLKVLQETRRLIRESFLQAKIQAIKWFAQNLAFIVVLGVLTLVAVGIALVIVYLASRFIKRR